MNKLGRTPTPEEVATMLDVPTDDETGLEQFYDRGAGHYAVEVQTGPAYATRRQESLAHLFPAHSFVRSRHRRSPGRG